MAEEVQEELSRNLRDMQLSVNQTARGRCRPDVLAAMSGYQKLRGVVSKHRLAIKTAELAMHKKNLEGMKEKENKANQAERERQDAADLAKERATREMVLREKKLREMTASLNVKKEELKDSFAQNLMIAEKACGETDDFVKMCFSRPEQSVTHVRSLLREMKKEEKELESALNEEERAAFKLKEKKALLASFQDAVNKSEAKLQEEFNALSKDLQSSLRANVRAMGADELSKMWTLKDKSDMMAARADDLRSLPDYQSCISKTLSLAEEKFRQSWAKLSPRLEDAVVSALVHSDLSVDSADAALKAGDIGKAVKELQKAELAMEKAKMARAR